MSPHSADRILGCLVGGAVGDALGAPYEGLAPPVEVDPAQAWTLTDDTQLTLATCEAIVAAGSVDPAAIAARMADWFRAGRVTGIGASTYKALSELAAGGHWALVGSRGERAAGNGAAMRIAPLAFHVDPESPAQRQLLRDVSRITHHHDEAYCGALAVVVAIRAAWDGTWNGGRGLLRQVAGALPDTLLRDRVAELAALPAEIPLIDVAARFGSSGYVVESVPLAIAAGERLAELGFRRMLETIVTLGGDVDTIASLAGQIAGCHLGWSGLPADWVERLPARAAVLATAEQFARSCRPQA